MKLGRFQKLVSQPTLYSINHETKKDLEFNAFIYMFPYENI